MSFDVGDVVQLKSGGPLMTVSGYSSDEQVICVYFSDEKKIIREIFVERALLKVDEDSDFA